MNGSRHLRRDLLSLLHSRGEILDYAIARHGKDEAVRAALQSGISIAEVDDSVRLYRMWRQFVAAEQWNRDFGGEPPTTCQAALDLIERWRRYQNPVTKPPKDRGLARAIVLFLGLSFAIQCACTHHSIYMQETMPGFSLLEEIVIGCPFETAERTI